MTPQPEPSVRHCKVCGEYLSPRDNVHVCQWLAGYEAARKQAERIALTSFKTRSECKESPHSEGWDDCARGIADRILAMQPEVPQ